MFGIVWDYLVDPAAVQYLSLTIFWLPGRAYRTGTDVAPGLVRVWTRHRAASPARVHSESIYTMLFISMEVFSKTFFLESPSRTHCSGLVISRQS